VGFEERRVLVTGAGGGVGRAVAVLFASEGAHVAIHYQRDPGAAEKTATACGMVGESVPAVVRGALHDWEEGQRVVAEAAAALGGLDVLVCTAERDDDTAAWTVPLGEITEELWEDVVEGDLRGSFTAARAAAPLLKPRGGSIVLVGSGRRSFEGGRGVPHAVAAAGLEGLTRALARELAPEVRVNAVALGSLTTTSLGGLESDERATLRDRIPLSRLGRPEDAARAVLFLASEDAAFVTGHTLIADGGGLRA
jgi:NAD(P)-dependent dehydrogenase (short-subunit alcohol dehydrogenase family)